MEDLFDPASAEQLRQRIQSVTPASPRQWGKMSAEQMMEHCARGLEMGTGKTKPPRVFIGRLLAPLVKKKALEDGELMRRDSPTAPFLIVSETPELDAARARLLAAFDRFVAGGEAGCTTHPHAFFGELTPAEWSKIMHKHLDHHLRQFGA
jgi:hypothetical protein